MYSDNYSQGCQSCQAGKWLCIFMTYLCNEKCHFCPSPLKKDVTVSAFGSDPEQILSYVKLNDFNGIGFSGGDPFMVFDRLHQWLVYFKTRLPEYYFWAYTNGKAVNEKKIRLLAETGLDELRFNIAATGYSTEKILKKIELAVKFIDHVAVEIPSIPEDYTKLISVLPTLDRLGVKYLNLHEYIYMDVENVNQENVDEFIMSKRTKHMYHTKSLENTQRIKTFCKEKNLSLKINSCSLEKKENQMIQRRLKMGHIFKSDQESLTKDGILITYLAYPGKLSYDELIGKISSDDQFNKLSRLFFHPTQLNSNKRDNSSNTLIKFSFLPPMGIDDERELTDIEIIN